MNYDYDYCHLITGTSSTTALVLHCCSLVLLFFEPQQAQILQSCRWSQYSLGKGRAFGW